MKNFTKQMARLLSSVDSPSTAVFIETLCKDPGIDRQIQQRVVRELSKRLAADVYSNELEDTCMFEEVEDDEDIMLMDDEQDQYERDILTENACEVEDAGDR